MQTDRADQPTSTPATTEDASGSTLTPTLQTDGDDGEPADGLQLPNLESQEDTVSTDSQLNSDELIPTDVEPDQQISDLDDPLSTDTRSGSESAHSSDDDIIEAHADTTEDSVTPETSDVPNRNDAAGQTTDPLVSEEETSRSEPTESDNSTPAEDDPIIRRRSTRSRANGADGQKKGRTRSQYSMRPGRRPPD